MTLAPFRGADDLPVWSRPVPVSAGLAYYAEGDARLGGAVPSPEQADADPRLVPHLSPALGQPDRAEIEEAKQRLEEAEFQCRPAQPAAVVAWCRRLTELPRCPEDAGALQAAMATVCVVCADLPAAVWTMETATEALRTWMWWPAPAEVYALLSEKARPILRLRNGLRRVATAMPERPPRPPPKRSQEARDAVQAVVAAVAAERMYHRSGPTSDEAKPKPAPLSHGALIMVWEQAAKDGVPGAALRVEILRKQLRGAVPR